MEGEREGEEARIDSSTLSLKVTQFNLFNPLTSCFEATRLLPGHGGRARARPADFLGSANFWWPLHAISPSSSFKGRQPLLDKKTTLISFKL